MPPATRPNRSGEIMNRHTVALAVALAFSQTASAADPAIEAGLNAAGCAPFMKRMAMPASTPLESPLYGKALGAWKTEDFQYMLDFGKRCYRAELSESMAAREAEVLRSQINDRIDEIRQRHQRAEAQRKAERQMATAKADDYAIETEPAAQQASQGVIQDNARITQIENDFRDRYRAEVDNPKTSVGRLNAIMSELQTVKGGLAYSPRLTTFEMHIKHQIKMAQRREQIRPLTGKQIASYNQGVFYGLCQILGVQLNNENLIQAALAKMGEQADAIRQTRPDVPRAELTSGMSGAAAPAYPRNRAGLQELFDNCSDQLDF